MTMKYSSKHVGLHKWNFKINQLYIVLELVTYLRHVTWFRRVVLIVTTVLKNFNISGIKDYELSVVLFL
jgi:hypothetical protein